MIGCCSIKLQIYALIPAPTIDELLQVGEEDGGGGGRSQNGMVQFIFVSV